MSITRYHSLALGKYKNFQARTDGLIGVGDTTPSVALYSLLYADTAGALAITYFDDAEEGQLVGVLNLGTGDVTVSGAQIVAADSSALATNDIAFFVNHNSAFYELYRSHANSAVATAGAGDASPSVKNVKTLIFNSAGAITVTNFDDATDGQFLTVVNLGTAVTISNGTIINGRSDQAYVLTTQDATSYVYDGSNWYNVGIGATAV